MRCKHPLPFETFVATIN